MSFEDIINRHIDHNVVIIPRLHKGKYKPVPGLYCEHCCKLIKWLSPEVAKNLVEYGVEELDMLKDEKAIWNRRQSGIKRLLTAYELDI